MALTVCAACGDGGSAGELELDDDAGLSQDDGGVNEPVCDAEHVGASEERVRYVSDEPDHHGKCASEVQTRTCLTGGYWGPWSGLYTYETCKGETLASCGKTSHGSHEQRVAFQVEVVPYGTDCRGEQQERRCDNGAWSAWTGTYLFHECRVAPPASCDGKAHGTIETRMRFAEESVPHGSTCEAEEQKRGCSNGTWSAWTGKLTAETCTVDEPLDCDGGAHGDTRSELRYPAAEVPFGEECVGEEQVSTCDNGTWTPFTGFAECVVLPAP